MMIEQSPRREKASRWSIIRRRMRSGNMKRKHSYRGEGGKNPIDTNLRNMELDSRRDYIMDMVNNPEVLRRLSLQNDIQTQLALQDFMNDMMETLTEINNRNRTDSMKKLRGIIKKTMNSDARPPKPKSTVHFSEENIYIEIPRIRKKKIDIVMETCAYYCCFGFLFPV